MDRGRESRRNRKADFRPVHCRERPHADCQATDRRTRLYGQDPLRPAGRKASAGEALQVESQVCCGNFGAARVHRLYGEFQDLFQVSQAEKTAV